MPEASPPSLYEVITAERSKIEQNQRYRDYILECTGELTPDLLKEIAEDYNILGACVKFVRQGGYVIFGNPTLKFPLIAAARGLMTPVDEGIILRPRESDDHLIAVADASDLSLRSPRNHAARPYSISLIREVVSQAGLRVIDKTYYR